MLKRTEVHAKDLGLVENGAHDGNINVAQREMREALLPVESEFEISYHKSSNRARQLPILISMNLFVTASWIIINSLRQGSLYKFHSFRPFTSFSQSMISKTSKLKGNPPSGKNPISGHPNSCSLLRDGRSSCILSGSSFRFLLLTIINNATAESHMTPKAHQLMELAFGSILVATKQTSSRISQKTAKSQLSNDKETTTPGPLNSDGTFLIGNSITSSLC
ncbi:hypothetical protein KY284_000923 [Solanum tuberosum]|nr:hypothetical protein KY284_000923 [Solanum tuberosum]